MSAFDGFPTLEALGAELARVAEAEAGRTRRPWRSVAPRRRSLVLAFALALALAATAAAATLLILRGSVIPAPSVVDIGRSEVPIPSSAQLIGLVSTDPGGGLPWTLRVARSQTGLVCSTVGQLRPDGTFGLTGLDGRFRQIATGFVDGCGQQQANATTLLGARVFDARSRPDVRTVVNGVAGDTLREVTIAAGGTVHHPPIGPGGTYVLALRGYPEDIGIVVDLRFADGHTEHHPLGTSQYVVTDPAGGPAWSTLAFVVDKGPQCIDVRPARQQPGPQPISPAACGNLPARSSKTRGYFFAVRRMAALAGICPHVVDVLADGRWCGAPSRTLVWGMAGAAVRAIDVVAAGATRQVVISPARSFLAVLDPSVDPAAVTVVLRFRDGTSRSLHGDTNLVRGYRPS